MLIVLVCVFDLVVLVGVGFCVGLLIVLFTSIV